MPESSGKKSGPSSFLTIGLAPVELTVTERRTTLENAMKKQALVERLKLGCPEAFEELVAVYGRRLYSVSFRILRNASDAEDAVQETFLSVLRNIGSFREESALYTWLYPIVCNQSLAKLRSRNRRQTIAIEDYLPRFERGEHAESILDWRDVPETRLRASELSDFFEKCIDELPEEFRLAYLLKDVEGLSEEGVCEILQIPATTMKNRVHRARVVIRKRVEDRFRTSERRSLCGKGPR